MTVNLIEPVVLSAAALEHGLQRGDLATVVEVYDEDAFEVEFVNAAGEMLAVRGHDSA